MSDKPNYDFPYTDATAATRETSLWTALTIGVIVAVALAIMGLGLYYTNVIRPAQLAGERQQDVQSEQNLAGQRAAITQDIQDWNSQQASIQRLASQPQSANRDAQLQQAASAQKADVNAAHEAADNLPSVSVLPADQQQFLKDHPRS
jgi:hypothetical protein